MKGLLKLVPDVPVEIALSCTEGVNVISPRGTPAVRYTLVDGRTFFATSYVAAKFKKLKVEANQRIALCMRNIDGKSITMVEPVTSDSAPNQLQEASGNGALRGEPEPIEEFKVASEGHHDTPATPYPDTLMSSTPVNDDPGVIDCGRKDPETTEGNCPSQLERALKTAIRATHSAEQYAKEIGYSIRFDQESIKCMAVTVLIGMQGGRY